MAKEISGEGIQATQINGHCPDQTQRLVALGAKMASAKHGLVRLARVCKKEPTEGPEQRVTPLSPHPPKKPDMGVSLFFFLIVECWRLWKLMADLSFDCMIEILLINFSGSYLIIQIKIQRKAKRMITPHLGIGGGGCETRLASDYNAVIFHLRGLHKN